MKTFIFPGSFDPFSLGHIDIAKRASRLCDKLVVAVMINRAKNSLFTVEERVEMAKICLKDVPNIEVISRESLLVDVYRELGASAVVRGPVRPLSKKLLITAATSAGCACRRSKRWFIKNCLKSKRKSNIRE